MTRQIILCLLAITLVALSGCRIDSDANFYVADPSDSEQTFFTPLGYNWVPGSRVEILVLAEPGMEDGKLIVSSEWRSMGFVNVDYLGMFGTPGSVSTKFVVKRILCGSPPPSLKAEPLFMARDTDTGKIRFFSGHNYDWFNFKPCP